MSPKLTPLPTFVVILGLIWASQLFYEETLVLCLRHKMRSILWLRKKRKKETKKFLCCFNFFQKCNFLNWKKETLILFFNKVLCIFAFSYELYLKNLFLHFIPMRYLMKGIDRRRRKVQYSVGLEFTTFSLEGQSSTAALQLLHIRRN